MARPRLLEKLVGRWQHRAITLVGGPGLGKTTLLAQTLHENRTAPRGVDVWLGIEPDDAEGDTLAQAAAEALARHADDDVETATVADAVWRRSPTQVCLVLDDVHLLPEGSDGARWLADLIETLPANGHVVLTSRSEPPVPLARMRSRADVLDLGEDDLRFTGDELAAFADRRGLDPAQFEQTGGWPALAELASAPGGHGAGEYLWEEVLAPLGDARRRILAVLCELGSGDSELVSAVLDTPVDLAEAVGNVPLVAHDTRGWYAVHSLWRSAPGLGLPDEERDAMRSRAVAHLTGRGLIDEAFSLLKESGSWQLAPQVLRAACLASDRLTSPRLRRWLAQVPDEVRASPPGRLAMALRTAFTEPADATEPLRKAARELRNEGDVDAELIAIAELGKLAWWRQDPLALDVRFIVRVGHLGLEGNAAARALAALGTAVFADIGGNDEGVLAALDSVGPGHFPDPAWEIQAGFLEAVTRVDLGDAAAGLRVIERFDPPPDRISRAIYDTVRLLGLWFLGRVDQVIDEMPPALEQGLADGVGAHSYVGLGGASMLSSMIGDVGTARRCLDQVDPVVPPGSVDKPPPLVAAMRASLLLAEGDEDQATRIMRDALQNYGVDQGVNRRVWRFTLALNYVLVEEIRPHWDDPSLGLQGHLEMARDLARLVVTCRSGAGCEGLATADLPAIGMIRAVLHHRFAAELAVGLHAAGRPEGPALLEALGPPGRDVVRALAGDRPPGAGAGSRRSASASSSRSAGRAPAGHTRLRKQARALLAALPAPPPRPTFLRALGPMAVHRDGWKGEEVADPTLRRKRVRELLSFLIGHRTTTRAALMAALWPDNGEDTSSNNLAVTLSYLLRVLEPWRPAGEPAFLIRVEGQSVKLVTGEHLHLDVDEFDDRVALAGEAEADGLPSVALEHHLAAVDLYRGELYAGLPETSWLALDREHYCTRFIAAATRAGQLLLGRDGPGDIDRAEAVADRAIEIDPWAEDAHGVLIAAALMRGDRRSARQRLDGCLEAITDLGLEPSDATRRLQRRVLGDDPAASER